MTSAEPGVSSAFEIRRPSAGVAPSIGSSPSVTASDGTSSGSARPVTLSVSLVHRATSWNNRPSSRNVKYRNGALPVF